MHLSFFRSHNRYSNVALKDLNILSGGNRNGLGIAGISTHYI